MKLYLNMPVGETFGWAICGKNMLNELMKKTDVKYIPDGYENVSRSHKTSELLKSITEKPNGGDYNVLATIDNVNECKFKGEKTIGYMFWEHDVIPDYLVEQLKKFDIIATGSHWNTEVVRKYGFDNVVTVHQGVDTDIFKPQERQYFEDKFVIFSGGKLEHRKAQDIVAHAVGYMQKKYPNIWLVTTWANVFASEEETTKMFEPIKGLLDKNRTIVISVSPQKEISKLIANTDIGIFPNRSEGGTNLVMMEYMACGKPVVANYATGQKDVLDKDRAFLIDGNDEELVQKSIDALEYAYHNREKLKDMGDKAREAMSEFTWEKTATEFLELYGA